MKDGIILGEVASGDVIELFKTGTPVRVTRGAHRLPGDRNTQVRIRYTQSGLDGSFNYTGRPDDPIVRVGRWNKGTGG